MTQEATAVTVAQWMKDEIDRDGDLYQAEAAQTIWETFGEQFAPDTDSGGLSVAKAVREEFRKLTSETHVWDKGEKCWRRREPDDEPGVWVQ